MYYTQEIQEIVLKDYPDNHFDSCVTDSPYGIRFMGKAWDDFDISKKHSDREEKCKNEDVREGRKTNGFGKSLFAGHYDLSPQAMVEFQSWFRGISQEIYRVLKPGAYFLNFSSPRTYHRMACGVEEAGFEIRDQMMWIFASGFPKSHNLEGDFDGWGTALKPSHEPIVVARKPFHGTVKKNMETYGVGALNIDACRIEGEPWHYGNQPKLNGARYQPGQITPKERYAEDITGGEQGRWPANIIHDGSDEVRSMFPDSKGQQGDLKDQTKPKSTPNGIYSPMGPAKDHKARIEQDPSAARFFYCAKISTRDRNEGLPNGLQNDHPTVKPTDLMRYLIRLVTPRGGLTLDPFRGSGSSGKAAAFEFVNSVGIDMDEKWEDISRYRIQFALNNRDNQIKIDL